MLKSIGANAFGSSGVSINLALDYKNGVTYTAADKVIYDIKLPASVTTIEANAFANPDTGLERRNYYKSKYNLSILSSQNGK